MPTHIEWADETWNPTTGCTKVDEGCRNCYADRMAKRLRGRFGYPEDKPFQLTLHPDRLSKPLRWKKPRRIFVDSMSDLFHKDVPDRFIMSVWEVMAQCPQHEFMILTKRPERMARVIVPSLWSITSGLPLPNVWLGVSIDAQKAADERIPILLQTPAAKRFVSYEPALGAVDFTYLENGRSCGLTGWYITPDKTGGGEPDQHQGEKLDLVIMGGESGHGARPTHPDWARTVRDDCAAAGVPFMFKQWGNWRTATHKENIAAFRANRPTGFWLNGSWHNNLISPSHGLPMLHVPKKAAGRQLDWVVHEGG